MTNILNKLQFVCCSVKMKVSLAAFNNLILKIHHERQVTIGLINKKNATFKVALATSATLFRNLIPSEYQYDICYIHNKCNVHY